MSAKELCITLLEFHQSFFLKVEIDLRVNYPRVNRTSGSNGDLESIVLPNAITEEFTELLEDRF